MRIQAETDGGKICKSSSRQDASHPIFSTGLWRPIENAGRIFGWPQFLTRKLRWERTLAMMWEGRHLANATLASLDVSGLVISLERSVRTMRKVVLSRVLWAMVIQEEWDKVSEEESAEGGLQR